MFLIEFGYKHNQTKAYTIDTIYSKPNYSFFISNNLCPSNSHHWRTYLYGWVGGRTP
ncbi:hypothetical protein HanIR_Chr05g0247561 [Helianthus annuus]|nr:hypothetical protein HanIR_Chr05g0247561 [Helianthus annuus]